MAATKKAASSNTAAPTVRVEYDCGIKGERRAKEFENAAKAKKFIAAKERAGKNPKVLKARSKKKAKPKLQELKDLWAAGEYQKALKLTASWSRLGEHKDAIRGGWDATVNSRIYREMDKDPDAMYAAGLAAVASRYGLPPAPVDAGETKAEDVPGTTTSATNEKPTTDKTKEQTKKLTPNKPTVPGVRPMRTRPYLAGTIIAKYGLAAGVTDAMVAELDETYGKPNPTESKFCLKNAFHAARGYLGITEDAVE